MEPCPYCSKPIPENYMVEGGICDSCGQLILGEDDMIEDEPTNQLLQDDMPTDEVTMGQGIELKRPTRPLYELEIQEDFGVKIDGLTQSLPAHAMGETKESVEAQKDLTVNIAMPGRRSRPGEYGTLIIGGALFMSIIAIVLFAQFSPNQEFRRFTGISIFFPDEDRHVDSMVIEDEKPEEIAQKKPERQRRSASTNNTTPAQGTNAPETIATPSSVDDLSSLLMPTVSGNTLEVDSIGSGPKKTDSQITNEFNRKLGELKICHSRATKGGDEVRGRWKIKVTVNADGSTRNFSLRPEREPNASLEECISGKGEKWNFTAPGDVIPLETTLIYN